MEISKLLALSWLISEKNKWFYWKEKKKKKKKTDFPVYCGFVHRFGRAHGRRSAAGQIYFLRSQWLEMRLWHSGNYVVIFKVTLAWFELKSLRRLRRTAAGSKSPAFVRLGKPGELNTESLGSETLVFWSEQKNKPTSITNVLFACHYYFSVYYTTRFDTSPRMSLESEMSTVTSVSVKVNQSRGSLPWRDRLVRNSKER